MTPTELEDRIRTTYRTVVPDLAVSSPPIDVSLDGAVDVELGRGFRRTRPLVVGVAAAMLAALSLGGWLLTRQSDNITSVAAPSTTEPAPTTAPAPSTTAPAASDRVWMPAGVPPGWILGATLDRLEPSRRLFVTSDGAGRALALGVYDGGFSDQNPFTDAVDLDGRTGDIEGSGLRFRLRLTIGDRSADIRSVGLTEDEVRSLGRRLVLAADRSPVIEDVPAGFGPWAQLADDDISQIQSWWSGDRTLARIIVSSRPQALADYLQALAGPLQSRTYDNERVLVGGTATGAAADPWDDWVGTMTAAYLERDGLGFAILGGDGGGAGSQVVDVLRSMRQVDAADVDPAPSTGGPAPNDGCAEPAPSARRLSFEGFDVVLFPSGKAVCMFQYESGSARWQSSWALDSIAMDTWSGSSSPHAYTTGLTPDNVATVVIERRDRTTVVASTYEMQGTGARVWILPVSPEGPVRALEYLDAAGSVVRRIGRPA